MVRFCIFLITGISFIGAGCAENVGSNILSENIGETADSQNHENEESTTEEDIMEDTGVEAVENNIEKEVIDSYLIEEFPIIYQMPELPTGCEITAMTMVLNFYGCDVNKVTMASDYLPTASAGLHYGEDGKLYGSDMYNYFIGDPASESGYICGPGAIVTAANGYFSEHDMQLQAFDITGKTPEELYLFVEQNIPVVVWVTIGMADRASAQGWYTESGNYVDWSTNDHGAVLIGYTDDTVTIADPISGQIEYDRSQFESVFTSRGCQCVIIE